MEDENFGPEFNDDFLDNYDPSNFNDPDDEADYYLTTLNNLNQQVENHPSNVPNENNPFAPANEFKRQHSNDKPLGQHPLDWFVKSDFDSESVKRKKLEQGELKRLSLLDKIVSKKNQLFESQSNVGTVRRATPKEPYLLFAPTDGSAFYKLSSPDCLHTGYIRVCRPQSAATERLRTRIERPIVPVAVAVNPQSSITQQKIPTNIKHDTEQLWTEKYQPKSFLELLTENEHNKVVLTWLKLWDQHVFKREKTYEFTVNDFYKSMLDVEETAPFLPKRKMLFLHGPSGCSKTMLAKICALQAGYRPVFIDASEFPNAAKFRESLSEATGNAKISFNLELRKPVCPIIENIDGASADVINCLMNDFARDKQSSKKHKRIVRRPVILISSNFFAASLRKLRPACFAVHITALNKTRTIARLEKICLIENLNIKRHLLIELFDQCNQDLRMCLNNLQFLCSIWWKEITFSKECNAKISEFSIFEALNNIVTTNPHYKGNKLLPPKQRSQTIASMLSRCSDLDSVYHAIFYNTEIIGRLRANQKRRLCGLLTDDDMLNSFMRHTQTWTLLRYTNTAGILIHFCLANYNAKRLVYNLGFMKYGEKVRECRELIASLMESLKPQFRLSPTGLQLELLPALYTIIQPFCTLSATQLQFCDPEELKLINRIVEVMSFYGLSYSSSFDNLTLDMRLDPPIENLVVYQTSAKTTTLNTNAKKLISQLLSRKQIENEAIRQIDQLVVNQSKSQPQSQGTVELLSDQQRVPGLALLGHRDANASTARGDLIYISNTKLLYRQGNSQAIRTRVQNKQLF